MKAFAVARLCRVVGVSRSGYYQWRGRRTYSPRQVREEVYVRAAFAASHQTYGSRRVLHAVRAQGLAIGRFRVRTLMKRAQLQPHWTRRFVVTTQSNPNLRAGANVLNRQFAATQVNQAWVTDVTYIATQRGWLYVAAVLDLYSRKVVGWATSPRLLTPLVVQAVQMAIGLRHPPRGLLLHSDRGTQYTSDAYQQLLYRHGMTCSMSRSGDCWDNAVMERFFLSLKREWTWQRHYTSHAQAAQSIEQYISQFYNSVRLHSTLGYVAPDAYEKSHIRGRPWKLSVKT